MDKITLNDLYNMGDVLYGELEKIKAAIPEVPTVWDAVIRLTHADNSGPDDNENLTPTIVSGSFAELSAKVANGAYPCILVQYEHPWGMRYAVPIAHLAVVESTQINIVIYGYSFMNVADTMEFMLHWTNSDVLSF